ncbi:TFIIB-type zinc ribbon-containing protein [Arenibacterium sp. CAU 1754]
MKCPLCHIDLKMSERHGVEVDYCPKCRGVWLDRGELDKIIEKATEPMVLPDPDPKPRTQAEPPREWREPYSDDRHDEARYEDRRGQSYDDRHDEVRYERATRYPPKKHKKKRKSILAEIFDFD